MEAYNFPSFRKYMMKEDMHFQGGRTAGEVAPTFDLPTTDGARFRLEEFRGKQPVVIEFGSFT